MDDIRKKIIIIFCAVVGLIVAAVLVMQFYNRPKINTAQNGEAQTSGQTTDAANGGNQQAAQGQTVAPTAIVKPKFTTPPAEVYVKQLSGIFIERFLSFSNQDDNQHITDVLPMVTDVMAKWINKQGVAWSQEYQGSIAKVIASSVKEITGNKAVVNVDVQQTFDGKENKTLYKSGSVELIKVGKDWKINGFYWE